MPERNLDFDSVIDRRNTNCLKYDFAKRRGLPEDVLPFWVADMDFATSSYVEDALADRIKHGIFGYSEVGTEYFNAVCGWMERHHEWKPEEKWLVKTPGVVFALAMAVKAYTEPGDAVLLQSPVYYPFSEVIEDNGRRVVSNTLYLGGDNRYHMDFEDFERKIVEEKIKLFFLCNPHNPVGRVWTREELETIGDICVQRHVIVVSDEIHQDFTFRGTHHVFAGLKKEYEDIALVCTSPSKTFNLASMLVSNIFIPNPSLRRKFRKELDAAGISQLSILGLTACEAAYSKGEEWYQAMRSYVAENIAFTEQYIEKNFREEAVGGKNFRGEAIGEKEVREETVGGKDFHGKTIFGKGGIGEQSRSVRMTDHEGTYLVWLDFRGTGLSAEELDERIVHRAKLWLDSGKIFGESGRGFQRINVACPRSVLLEALERIRKVIQE